MLLLLLLKCYCYFPHSSLAARQKDLKKFVTPAPGMYEVGLLSYYVTHFGLECLISKI